MGKMMKRDRTALIDPGLTKKKHFSDPINNKR